MKVKLESKNDAFHLEATGANGRKVSIDAGEGIGGHDLGVRPVELLLMSVASCTSIDFKLIMNKQRQKLTKYEILVDSTREGEQVKPFKTISLHFDLWGENLSETKIEKAIELAMYKYCSVSESLDPNIKITYTYKIH
jgi:putative redox protein